MQRQHLSLTRKNIENKHVLRENLFSGNFSLSFRAGAANGLLVLVANADSSNYLAVYLLDGFIVFT